MTIGYTFGWRMQSEALRLEMVDLGAGTLRVDPGAAKNDDGRSCLPHAQTHQLLTAHVTRAGLGRELKRVVPWLFPHFPNPTSARP